jgi:hypothetical protein
MTEITPLAKTSTSEILAERQTTHGDFADVATLDQMMKDLFKTSPNWNRLTDVQRLSLEMIAHKIARILSGDPNHPDHQADIIGYASLFSHTKSPK